MRKTNFRSNQASLFPPAYFMGRIIQKCDEQTRQNNVLKVDELIKITPLLNQLRKEQK